MADNKMKGLTFLDQGMKERHGDDSSVPRVKKGTFIDGGGTYVGLPSGGEGISPNRKTGTSSGGEQ